MSIKVLEFPAGSNLEGYSVTEESTPIDPGSFSGGTTGINLSTLNFDGIEDLLDQQITLVDDERGSVPMLIRSLDNTDGFVTVGAASAMDKFNTWHTIKPFNGTLSDYFTEVFAECRVTNTVTYEGTTATKSVTTPGFYGNVWDALKQFCAAYQIQIRMSNGIIYVSPIRNRTAVTTRLISDTRNITTNTAAATVDVTYYDYKWHTSREVYPTMEDADADTFTTSWVVGARQRLVQTLDLNGSLRTVNQPVVQDFVYDQSYTGTSGVYAVCGADNLPITAAQWTAKGGKLSVELTEDPGVVKIILTGANIPELAPFRLAMVAPSTGTYYNSLHITGEGASSFPKTLTLRTGAREQDIGQETGVSVENPFIGTLAQAYTAGVVTAGNNAGPDVTRGGTATTMTPDTGQFFGNVPGARLLDKNANYRIDQVTTSEHEVSFTATIDTTIEDFNNAWSGKTIADFNAVWAGKTLKQFRVSPLRKV